MTEDSEGRERRSDDLFEDLDKFFAPIRDVDWPEEKREGGGGPGQEAEGPIEWRDPRDKGRRREAQGEGEGPGGAATPTEELGSEGGEDEWGELRAKLGDEEPPGQPEQEEEHDAATSGEEFSFMKDFLPEGEEAEGSEPLFPADEEAEEAPGALGGDEESD